MLLFLRDFWIEKTIYEQVYNTAGRWKRKQKTSFNAQMIDVVKRRSDSSFEVCVSDSRHFIDAVLAREAIEEFGREVACGIEDVKGCYITVDEFYYEYSFASRRFFVWIEKFTYCGGECDTYGDPSDINEACFLRSLANSPLYMKPVPGELMVHKTAIGCVGSERERIGLMTVLEQNDDLCGDGCYLCRKLEAEGRESDGSGSREHGEKQKTRRYNPFEERMHDGMNTAVEDGKMEIKRIYIFDGMYVEKEAEKKDRWESRGRYLDLCSDSEEEGRRDLLE
ncbi:hypothetical protein [Encephalitozoon cuniculi GB-M1]|uniref:Shelterin complex subunit TPP1/Est3 domain-containing protein n=2 Tax=Encephalitozoon cuniculi TaxID=6035 RepID=Q8SU22_ENCCU|nr:uncharacterized protein ECU11_1410 [Encephalitozoon cuniculi GB-M1]AGE94935.1 hypothetical protein ECU11_1410 [Encephalitozoon cuniculi]KMV65099.1 hypothetical protein M970_111410 [Encephalitozoon cuniculi EcunIII-L]UYI26347.1 putative shelterin complex subunit [Encephalitozoon cuniculi]CAD26051.1 hypothetical protein [Encephalitozoon cuniculi GB-M1]